MQLDEVADNVLSDWEDRRLRLWLTSLRDSPEAFGQWAGLVRLRAEFFADRWQPARDDLLHRLHRYPEDGAESRRIPEVILPMAADALEADLRAKGVPKDMAARARELLTMDPPVAQWKL